MKLLKLLSLCLALACITHMRAMELTTDGMQNEESLDTETMILLKINDFHGDMQFRPLHAAIVSHQLGALRIFLNNENDCRKICRSRIVRKWWHGSALDCALLENYKEAIEELVKHPTQCSYGYETFNQCDLDTFLHFATKLHELHNNNSELLSNLSNTVITHCQSDRAREFIKRGYLRFPSYPPEENTKKLHDNVYQGILSLYTQYANDIPQEAHQSAQRYFLRYTILHDETTEIWNGDHPRRHSKYEDNKKDVIEILSTITFPKYDNDKKNEADRDLALNLYAFAFLHNDIDLLTRLEKSNVPLPDKEALTFMLQYYMASHRDLMRHTPQFKNHPNTEKNLHSSSRLISRVKGSHPIINTNSLTWCLDHDANANGTNNTPQYRPWIQFDYLWNAHPLKQIVKAAIYQRYIDLSRDKFFRYFYRNGDQYDADAEDIREQEAARQAFTLLKERGASLDINNSIECAQLIDYVHSVADADQRYGKSENNDLRIWGAYFLLNTEPYKDIALDEKTSTTLYNLAQEHIEARHSHEKREARFIQDRLRPFITANIPALKKVTPEVDAAAGVGTGEDSQRNDMTLENDADRTTTSSNNRITSFISRLNCLKPVQPDATLEHRTDQSTASSNNGFMASMVHKFSSLVPARRYANLENNSNL